MRRAWRGKASTREQARALREARTPSEVLLWSRLQGSKLGVKFRQQHPIGGFIADFYAPSIALVVEVDGPCHDDTRERDEDRDLRLRQRGLDVIRFSVSDVEERIDEVVGSIRERIALLRAAPRAATAAT